MRGLRGTSIAFFTLQVWTEGVKNPKILLHRSPLIHDCDGSFFWGDHYMGLCATLSEKLNFVFPLFNIGLPSRRERPLLSFAQIEKATRLCAPPPPLFHPFMGIAPRASEILRRILRRKDCTFAPPLPLLHVPQWPSQSLSLREGTCTI